MKRLFVQQCQNLDVKKVNWWPADPTLSCNLAVALIDVVELANVLRTRCSVPHRRARVMFPDHMPTSSREILRFVRTLLLRDLDILCGSERMSTVTMRELGSYDQIHSQHLTIRFSRSGQLSFGYSRGQQNQNRGQQNQFIDAVMPKSI
jgi:hypothetical protein